MDEVTYLVTLLDEYWNTAVTALGSTIPAIHRVKPQIMDIRSMASTSNTAKPGRGGNRVRISAATEVTADGVTPSLDVIVVMQNSQTIEYPTTTFDVRNETHEMSVSIRTKQDDRRTNDNARITPSGSTFGRDRIENLYKIVRGSRTDSNDKKSRIFGYRINVTMKRYAVSL